LSTSPYLSEEELKERMRLRGKEKRKKEKLEEK